MEKSNVTPFPKDKKEEKDLLWLVHYHQEK